jgi:hypothetical protein
VRLESRFRLPGGRTLVQQPRLHVHIVRHGRTQIDEENDRVDALFNNQCANLLIATKWPEASRVIDRLGQRAAMTLPVVPVQKNL